jgi:hypothetical protein
LVTHNLLFFAGVASINGFAEVEPQPPTPSKAMEVDGDDSQHPDDDEGHNRNKPDDDDGDPIIHEIPVFIAKSLQQNLHLFQVRYSTNLMGN